MARLAVKIKTRKSEKWKMSCEFWHFSFWDLEDNVAFVLVLKMAYVLSFNLDSFGWIVPIVATGIPAEFLYLTCEYLQSLKNSSDKSKSNKTDRDPKKSRLWRPRSILKSFCRKYNVGNKDLVAIIGSISAGILTCVHQVSHAPWPSISFDQFSALNSNHIFQVPGASLQDYVLSLGFWLFMRSMGWVSAF